MVSSQPGLRRTAFMGQSASNFRRGWTNFHFSVNGGDGAVVQAIRAAFTSSQIGVVCNYEVLYQDLSSSALAKPFSATVDSSSEKTRGNPAVSAQSAPALKSENENPKFEAGEKIKVDTY